MIIYITFPLPESARELIRSALHPDDICLWAQDMAVEDRKAAFLQAEVVFGKPPAEWLTESVSLRWLQLYSTGFDEYIALFQSDQKPAIPVTNLRGFYAQPVAESAVAGVMALYRRIDELARLQTAHHWVGGALRPTMQLLHKKNVLVLGAGAIGQAIQTILSGFDCQITFVRQSQAPTLDNLDDLLPTADIIISVLPDTDETVNVFTEKRLYALKPSAILVNAGRGSLIDEEALLKALQAKRLAGAVLDVTRQEPLPADHPLWDCPTVLLTQHTGGGYEEEDNDKARVFIKNLAHYRAGESLENLINFDRGY